MRATDDAIQTFRRLHEQCFIIPSAWDVLSAKIMRVAGFRAISTTSVGIGLALGFDRGAQVPRAKMLKAIRAICAAVEIPVSVDFESGYSRSAKGVEDTVLAALDAGIVGLNLHDSDGGPRKVLRPSDEHAQRIGAARRAGERAGVRLFVNARTDNFHIDDGRSEVQKLREAIRRGNQYLEAGADGVMVSSHHPLSAETVGELAQAIRGPLNILLAPGSPPPAVLKQLGVRRLSVGSAPVRAMSGFVTQALVRLRDEGDPEMLDHFAAR